MSAANHPHPRFWEHSPANKPGKKTWLIERRRSDVERLYEWGLRDPEAIGEELGLSPKTVRRYLRGLEKDQRSVAMLAFGWTHEILERYGQGDVYTVAHNLNVATPRGKLTIELPFSQLAEECTLTHRATEAALVELETAGLIYRKDARISIRPG